MANMKTFRCKYCGKVKSWDTDKGSRPPAYDTSTSAGDRCPKSPDRQHHYEPR